MTVAMLRITEVRRSVRVALKWRARPAAKHLITMIMSVVAGGRILWTHRSIPAPKNARNSTVRRPCRGVN